MQRRQKIAKAEQLQKALDDIGGERLHGSGFEDDTPDPEFSGAVQLPSTCLPGRPTGSH